MTILSLVAVGRLSERLVREAGGDLDYAELMRRLGALDVDEARARAGVRLAVTTGRLAEAESYPDGGAEGAGDLLLVTSTTVREAA